MKASFLRLLCLGCFTALAGPLSGARAQASAPPAAWKKLSLEELMSIEVTSVSRKEENWWSSPGASDVHTGEDIRRSGALTLQDSLRLMTGVHVTQPQARAWGIGMRGFTLPGGNKINVQIDGRSLFTPFYSGVFWDAQDVMLESVDRIEVVRGPVGALWGAYAVNGIIQITTKSAWETQGTLVSGTVATENAHVGSMRYGGKVGADAAYRVYAQYRALPPTYIDGRQAEAATDLLQAGFRADLRRPADTKLTLQGDVYTNRDTFRRGDREVVTGANVLGRWERGLPDGRDVQVVTYFDYTGREFEVGLSEQRRTFQVNAKYHAAVGRHDFLIGTDNMVSWDSIGNIPALRFDPAKRTVGVGSVYGNYTYHLVPRRLAATAGAKLEHNSFTGFEAQPSVRVGWTPSLRTTIWGAVSRAVRTPVRFDHDVVFPGVFAADDGFKSEEVLAFEVGMRQRFSERVAAGLTLFRNRYDNLRTYHPQGATLLPLTFRNYRNADSHGAELGFMVQLAERVRLRGGYRYLDIDLTEDPGAQDIIGPKFELNDARHVGTLTARIDVRRGLELDLALRGASALRFRATPGYITGDVTLGWTLNDRWQLSLIGRNLFRPYQLEAIIPQNETRPGHEVPRFVALRATQKF
jgi:iron complex outermembrane receptor protein